MTEMLLKIVNILKLYQDLSCPEFTFLCLYEAQLIKPLLRQGPNVVS